MVAMSWCTPMILVKVGVKGGSAVSIKFEYCIFSFDIVFLSAGWRGFRVVRVWMKYRSFIQLWSLLPFHLCFCFCWHCMGIHEGNLGQYSTWTHCMDSLLVATHSSACNCEQYSTVYLYHAPSQWKSHQICMLSIMYNNSSKYVFKGFTSQAWNVRINIHPSLDLETGVRGYETKAVNCQLQNCNYNQFWQRKVIESRFVILVDEQWHASL